MKKAIVLLAVLVLLLGSVVPSEAWRGHGHWRGGCCWGGWWWPGAVIGGLALGAAVAATYPLYAPPPVYAAPQPVVYQSPQPVVYQQPPAPVAYQQASPPPPPPPAPLVQREVVYPHGKHVLYGDGVTRPWQWVWIPAGSQASPQQ
jgi:hypothetical protein